MFQRLTRIPLIVHIALMIIAMLLASLYAQAHLDQHADPKGLLVATRDRLRVCATVAPALSNTSPSVLANLSKSLDLAHNHRDWNGAGYGAKDPELEIGCSALAAPGMQLLSRSNITNAPGPYRTVIIVVDSATADSLIGKNRDAEFRSLELTCESDDVCDTVTQGLVVRAGFLTNPDFDAYYFPLAVGLMPHKAFSPSPGIWRK